MGEFLFVEGTPSSVAAPAAQNLSADVLPRGQYHGRAAASCSGSNQRLWQIELGDSARTYVAARIVAQAGGAAFDEAAMFTHRGLSGPAFLQVS